MSKSKAVPFKAIFEEESCIGRGSFGIVCKVKAKIEMNGLPKGSVAAIKLINKKKLKLEELIALENEVNILRTVSSLQNSCHKNIVCYYGTVLVIKDGVEYFGIVTEFISGYQLSEFIDSLAKKQIDPLSRTTFRKGYDLNLVMTNQQIADLMKQLLATLAYIHSLGIAHRDIKTDNIMYIPEQKILKYIDFGFSCYNVIKKVEHQCRVKSAGTPLFISPEMWDWASSPKRNIRDITDTEIISESDVWSLGVVFYELLFGVAPFEDIETQKELESELESSEPIRFPISGNDGHLVDTIRLMLNKDYTQRITAQQAYNFVLSKYP